MSGLVPLPLIPQEIDQIHWTIANSSGGVWVATGELQRQVVDRLAAWEARWRPVAVRLDLA